VGVVRLSSAQTVSLPNGSVYRAGPDYATDVLQDPWDFLNPADVAPDPDQVGGWSFPSQDAVRTNGTGPSFVNPSNGGWFQGVPSNDPSVMLLSDRSGAIPQACREDAGHRAAVAVAADGVLVPRRHWRS
jgi:hypothetical protein